MYCTVLVVFYPISFFIAHPSWELSLLSPFFFLSIAKVLVDGGRIDEALLDSLPVLFGAVLLWAVIWFGR